MTNSNNHGWEETEAALSALINGKRRADGANWADAYSMSQHYLERLGLVEALNNIRVLHIAGTKGKGSTAAFADAILQDCGYTVGLFTSPHLCDVRERCRINGKLVSREDFSRVFWQCHEKLVPRSPDDPPAPGYFRFLTYLALQLFVEAKLDVVVLEVGIGGRLDSTNVIPTPVATAVTTLDYDHIELLGDTLAKIAREKAGIFRAGVPAYTCGQEDEAMESLRTVSKEVGCELRVVDEEFAQFTAASGSSPKLGLHGTFQKKNAAIAVAMCRGLDMHVADSKAPVALSDESLRQQAQHRVGDLKSGKLPEAYLRGLAQCKFAGRAQMASVPLGALPCFPQAGDSGGSPKYGVSCEEPSGAGSGQPSVTFYLDGAHTPASTAECAAWFHGASYSLDAAPKEPPGAQPARLELSPLRAGLHAVQAAAPSDERILVFNCLDSRDPAQLLKPFTLSGQPFTAGPNGATKSPTTGSSSGCPPAVGVPLSPPGTACMFDHAMFVPGDSVYSSVRPGGDAAADVSWQLGNAHAWEALLGPHHATPGTANGAKDELRTSLGRGAVHAGQSYSVHSSLKHALACIRLRAVSRRSSGRMHVLVTGSLHLVGDVLRHLGLAPV